MQLNWSTQKSWKDVSESLGNVIKVPAGGYVGKVIKVEDVPYKEYLKVYLDITEGEFTGTGAKQAEQFHNDNKYFIKYLSYKETAQGMFKHVLKCFEASNRNFIADNFDNNENEFVGLNIGFVLGEYESQSKKDGKIYLNTSVDNFYTIDNIHNKKFKIPPLKKLDQSKVQQSTFNQIPEDDEVPF